MTPLEVADAFVAAINSGEVNRLVGLMTREHMFVDADGSEHVGRDQMNSGWQEYFDLVPDFQIEVSDRFEDKGTEFRGHRSSVRVPGTPYLSFACRHRQE